MQKNCGRFKHITFKYVLKKLKTHLLLQNFIHLLTSWLTPEAGRSTVSREIFLFRSNQTVCYRVHRRSQPAPVRVQIHMVHIFTSYFLKVLLIFQLDVFYLFICRLYMFRATPIFRSFKCTLQTIGVCIYSTANSRCGRRWRDIFELEAKLWATN